MKVVVDAGIPDVGEVLGEDVYVVGRPGREIVRADLRDADALWVRSITQVDAALLAGTPVRFVGSATAGLDHIDAEYLSDANIAWGHAPGANANAVAEYVLAVVMGAWAGGKRRGAVGVVGFGHVGRRVTQYLRRLGCVVHVCDPPLFERVRAGDVSDQEPQADLARAERYRALDEVIAACSVITLHVPLTRTGRHPTHDLLGREELTELRPGTTVINTSRGGIVDETALSEIARRSDLTVALDVWNQEPALHWDLLRQPWLRIATPHIAGYSVDAKRVGTVMVAKSMAAALGLTLPTGASDDGGGPPAIDLDRVPWPSDLAHALAAATQLWQWDARLRALLHVPAAARCGAFDGLRAMPVTRRECLAPPGPPPDEPGPTPP